MGLNTGYLKATRTEEGNEQYTPFYAVDPITKYIPKTKKIWSVRLRMVSVLPDIQAGGWQVERSSIDDGQDFFTYQPEDFDVIVSNPPYTQKDRVIERLYELEKPFAVLLPLNSLQGVGRYRYFKNGIQILTFDKRIGFHNAESMEEYKKGSSFATAYFCRDILPRDLILEELREYRKPLKEGEKSNDRTTAERL